jgi:two-component system phosphate regulon sensor histidine kinase PhoR
LLNDQVESQLEELTCAKNEKEVILESLVEGVVAINADRIVTYINFVGEKMLGMSRAEIVGRIFPESEKSKYPELFKKSARLLDMAKGNKKIAVDSIKIDDGQVHLDLVAAPISNSKGAILVLQDNSVQYKIIEMGKDFVANASHELRTPITIIKGFAETLQEVRDMPQDMMCSVVDKIVRNCERMENLIKNLLTLADIENLSISPFLQCDLIMLIDSCIQIVNAVYADAIITFEKEDSILMIVADANLLELAIINLLTNAAKYSKKPAHIDIKVAKLDGFAKISIKDHGIGIPAADIGRIFERFYTVDKAHSRKMGGAGLGLSLVKTIIDKHHGSIHVESIVGSGTTFTVSIPLAKRS